MFCKQLFSHDLQQLLPTLSLPVGMWDMIPRPKPLQWRICPYSLCGLLAKNFIHTAALLFIRIRQRRLRAPAYGMERLQLWSVPLAGVGLFHSIPQSTYGILTEPHGLQTPPSEMFSTSLKYQETSLEKITGRVPRCSWGRL